MKKLFFFIILCMIPLASAVEYGYNKLPEPETNWTNVTFVTYNNIWNGSTIWYNNTDTISINASYPNRTSAESGYFGTNVSIGYDGNFHAGVFIKNEAVGSPSAGAVFQGVASSANFTIDAHGGSEFESRYGFANLGNYVEFLYRGLFAGANGMIIGSDENLPLYIATNNKLAMNITDGNVNVSQNLSFGHTLKGATNFYVSPDDGGYTGGFCIANQTEESDLFSGICIDDRLIIIHASPASDASLQLGINTVMTGFNGNIDIDSMGDINATLVDNAVIRNYGNISADNLTASNAVYTGDLYTSGFVANTSYGMTLPLDSGYVWNILSSLISGLYFDLANNSLHWRVLGADKMNLSLLTGDLRIQGDFISYDSAGQSRFEGELTVDEKLFVNTIASEADDVVGITFEHNITVGSDGNAFGDSATINDSCVVVFDNLCIDDAGRAGLMPLAGASLSFVGTPQAPFSQGHFTDLDVINDLSVEDVYLGSRIYHEGDENTYFNFAGGTDEIWLFAGGVNFIKMVEGAENYIVINEGSHDVDLRFESDNNPFFVYVDSGAETINISGKVNITNNIDGIGTNNITNFHNISSENLTASDNIYASNLYVSRNFTGNQIYGEMFYHNLTATSINFATQYQYYPLWFTNSTNLNGFSYVGGMMASSNLTAQVAGLYHLNYRLASSGQNNHLYISTVIINNGEQVNCHDHKQMSAGGDIVPMGSSCFVDLAVGDDVSISVADFSGTGTGNYYFGELNLMRIGS